jgi:MFS family permease
VTDRTPAAAPPPLWRHRDFRPLWAAETVSQIGTQVTVLAIPLMAIQVLHATTFEIGALNAVQFAPFILVGLQAGAIVDRLRRRPVMMVCDIGRAIVLATLPLAHWLGWLTMAQLYVVVFAHGVMTVFFDVANMAILPSIVPREQIGDGNAKLEVSRSAAQVAGPGLGGFLVQVIGSVTAVVVDAVSFVLSALFLSRVRDREVKIERDASQPRPRIRDDVREGLAFVWHNGLLRPIAFCTATSNLFSNMSMAVFIVYAVRELDYGAGVVGLVFMLGSIGALLGAFASERIGRQLGVGTTIVTSIFIGGLGMLLLAVAPRGSAFPWFVAGFFTFSLTGVVYNVSQVSLRQAITPDRLQGRMNAAMRFMVWGTIPIGSLVGGALGSVLGLRPTLVIGGIGGLLAVGWVFFSPVRALRTIPPPIDDVDADGTTPSEPEPVH